MTIHYPYSHWAELVRKSRRQNGIVRKHAIDITGEPLCKSTGYGMADTMESEPKYKCRNCVDVIIFKRNSGLLYANAPIVYGTGDYYVITIEGYAHVCTLKIDGEITRYVTTPPKTTEMAKSLLEFKYWLMSGLTNM